MKDEKKKDDLDGVGELPKRYEGPSIAEMEAQRPKLPTAPLEHVYEGVDRLSVPGGYLYLLSGFQPVFVAGA